MSMQNLTELARIDLLRRIKSAKFLTEYLIYNNRSSRRKAFDPMNGMKSAEQGRSGGSVEESKK